MTNRDLIANNVEDTSILTDIIFNFLCEMGYPISYSKMDINKWLNKNLEFQIGDEIKPITRDSRTTSVRVIIIKIEGDRFNGITVDGDTFSDRELKYFTKTGRTYPEFINFFNQRGD